MTNVARLDAAVADLSVTGDLNTDARGRGPVGAPSHGEQMRSQAALLRECLRVLGPNHPHTVMFGIELQTARVGAGAATACLRAARAVQWPTSGARATTLVHHFTATATNPKPAQPPLPTLTPSCLHLCEY